MNKYPLWVAYHCMPYETFFGFFMIFIVSNYWCVWWCDFASWTSKVTATGAEKGLRAQQLEFSTWIKFSYGIQYHCDADKVWVTIPMRKYFISYEKFTQVDSLNFRSFMHLSATVAVTLFVQKATYPISNIITCINNSSLWRSPVQHA